MATDCAMKDEKPVLTLTCHSKIGAMEGLISRPSIFALEIFSCLGSVQKLFLSDCVGCSHQISASKSTYPSHHCHFWPCQVQELNHFYEALRSTWYWSSDTLSHEQSYEREWLPWHICKWKSQVEEQNLGGGKWLAEPPNSPHSYHREPHYLSKMLVTSKVGSSC